MMQLSPLPENPFVGLRPFESTESLLFFGRGMQTGELLELLDSRRFVSVVGRSGCGKSSLIRAGLIPKLKAGFLVADRARWIIATMKPGDRPLHSLAAAVLEAIGDEPGPGAFGAQVEAFVEEIRAEGVEALTDRLIPTLDEVDASFLLLVDQFEEIFRFGLRPQDDPAGEEDAAAAAQRRDEAADFVSIMLGLSEQRDAPAYVVMTMRSDFLGDCDAFYGLPEAMNRSQYLVPRLSTQQREEAISGPIRLYGGAITPRLLDLVRNDVGDKLDQLPVMQHAMMRTWENWHVGGDGPIDVPDYQAAGTIKNALSDDAEGVLRRMGNEAGDRRVLTMRIFQALTDTDSENRRIRRPKRLRELEAITGVSGEKIMEIVALFRGGGRSFLTVSPDKAGDDHLIDISHESLIRQWKTLREWVDKEAESRSTYLRIADAAVRRQTKGGGLWDDPDLQQALDWWKQRSPTRAWAEQYHPAGKKEPSAGGTGEPAPDIYVEAQNFLEESRIARDQELATKERQRKRELRRTRLFALVVLIAFAVTSALGLYARRQANIAQEQTLLARANLEKAQQQEALAKISASNEAVARRQAEERAEGERLAKVDALKANKIAGEKEQQAELAKTEAQRQERIAKAQERKARENALRAEEAKRVAERRTQEAVEQKKLAEAGKALNTRLIYGSDIKLADNALQKNDTAEGVGLLQTYLADPEKGFEWRYLWRQHRRDFPILAGHEGSVLSLAASPDGRTIATASADGTLRLWDAAAGRELFKLTGHDGQPILAVAYAADGQMIATAGADNNVKLWKVVPGGAQQLELLKTLGHDGQVSAIAFAPGGAALAAGDAGGNVKIWDLATFTAKKTFQAHEGGVTAVAFSRDGKLLATGSAPAARVWDATTYEMRANFDYQEFYYSGVVSSLAFSKGGGKLFVCASSSAYALELGGSGESKQASVPRPLFQGCSTITFSQTGDAFAAGSSDGGIRVWGMDGDNVVGESVMLKDYRRRAVLSLSFLPGTRKLVAGGLGGTTVVWDITPSEQRMFDELATEDRPAGTLLPGAVAFSPDGKLAVTPGAGETIDLWDTRSLSKIGRLRGAQEVMFSLALSPAGNFVAGAGNDRALYLWKTDNPDAPPIKLGSSKANISTLAFSPDGKTLGAASQSGELIIWEDVTAPRPRAKSLPIYFDSGVYDLAFSPDGKTLAVGHGADVQLLDTLTWRAVKDRQFFSGGSVLDTVTSLSFSRDSKSLLLSVGDVAKIWDTTRAPLEAPPGKSTCELPSGQETPCSVVALRRGGSMAVFSHDGRTIATSSPDGTVRLWDAVTLRELATVARGLGWSFGFGPTAIIRRLSFSPDDRLLLGGGLDGVLRVWRTATDEEIAAQQ